MGMLFMLLGTIPRMMPMLLQGRKLMLALVSFQVAV
jgi:hypothetical protein